MLLLICLIFVLPSCSDFRAIFEGSPDYNVAKRKKKRDRRGSTRKVDPQVAKGYFVWPLEAPLSSLYGPRKGKFHDGIDIDGDSGDAVSAAASGEVVYSGRLGGYGRLIVVQHPNGYFTAYAHNKKNLVKKGKKVRKGQKIALVGSSGRSTGDHLHFEIRDKDGTYDPLDFLPRKRYSRRR